MTLWLVALPGFLTISSVSVIVIVMCLVPAAPTLLIFGSMDAIIIALWAQCSPDYKILYHGISIPTGRYCHQSFWNRGIFSSSA
jgi:hypothetical protein